MQTRYFKKFKNANVLRLIDGHTISKINNEFTNLSFSQSDVNLSDTKSNTILVRKTQEISTYNIIKCLSILKDFKLINFNNINLDEKNCDLTNINNLIQEIYKRLLIPFYIPVLMLVTLLLITKSKESTNFLYKRIYIFFTGFLVIVFSETTLRMIEDQINQNIKIFVIPFILILILYLIFYKSFQFSTSNIKK